MYTVFNINHRIRIKNKISTGSNKSVTGKIAAYTTIDDELVYVVELDTEFSDYLEHSTVFISYVVLSVTEVESYGKV